MHYILDNWSFDPFIILVAVVVAWHEIGLCPARQAVAAGADPGAADPVAVVLQRAAGAADRRRVADRLLVRLLLHGPHGAAPAADVRRAVARRRGRARAAAARRAARAVRAGGDPVRCWPATGHGRCARVWRFLTGPLVAVVLFNLVMVVWHIPAAFDLAAEQLSWCTSG